MFLKIDGEIDMGDAAIGKGGAACEVCHILDM
jgi:hypothetical protein